MKYPCSGEDPDSLPLIRTVTVPLTTEMNCSGQRAEMALLTLRNMIRMGTDGLMKVMRFSVNLRFGARAITARISSWI